MEVLVEHDYVAKEPNELTITKGDIIKDVTKKPNGWLEGTLKNKKGLFPDNFVKVIDKDSSVVLRNRKDASRIRQCRVVFSYKQDHEDELNLNVGDVIDILGEEEEGWWRGVLNGKEGVFPSNFVEEVVPMSSKLNSSRENIANSVTATEPPPLYAKPTKILCEVKFPYKAENDDELTLEEGDIVTLISKDGQDPGWWKGELYGAVGVFPDNFVTVLPSAGEAASPNPLREDKRPTKAHVEPVSVKAGTVNAQRKSLEPHSNEKAEIETAPTKTTPPLPGKKPSIPVKKSPSSSGSSGGIFYGLKKKLVDVVDGAGGSKISPPKIEASESPAADNAFDNVQRRPLLSDVRASRPKAPGRRPPSLMGRDSEPGLVNGNSEHTLETWSETSYTVSSEADPSENKPKLPEWAKHPAPWLEEMKLNQAKRSSHVPGQEKLNSRMKTPSNEFALIRNKSNVPTPARPQTIQSISEIYTQKQTTVTHTKVSPLSNKTPSPLQKIEKLEAAHADSNAGGDGAEEVTGKYAELERRIVRLSELVEKQQQSHEAAIEELRGKLQIETEMRMKLQAKLERFVSDGAIQQL